MGGPNTNTERTNGLRLWRAGCVETRTSGSEGGLGKPTEGNPGHGVPVRPYTYLPMARGFAYLVAIMDVYSRRILSWRLSNTMDTRFCVDALEEAMERFGKPEIFNSDQGSQFTSNAFTSVLLDAGIKVSMNGRGSWRDNVFAERFWWTLKFEVVYRS